MSKNWADLQNWNKDGKPIDVPDFKPLSRKNNPEKLQKQKLKLEEDAIALQNALIRDPSTVARRATGNQAPPLPMQTVYDVQDDEVESSALPEDIFNVNYVRGGMLKTIAEAEEFQKAGASEERVDRRVRTEDELLALRAKYTVLKGQTLVLPEWNPLMFPPDGTAVFFGRRRAGKSWMVRHLLHIYRHLYRGVIVLTNTEQNDFWAKHVPSRFIHRYDPFVIQKIIEHQRALVAWNILHADNPDLIKNPYIAIVLDDVVSGNMHHDPQLNQLFFEGRHSGMAIFITTQHPKALPPGVRSNADLAVIYPMWAEHDLDSIREQYCTFFEDKKDFNYLVRETTADRQCLIIFLGDPTVNPIQSVYRFKADDPGPFLLGAKEFWEGDAEAKKKKMEAMAAILTNNNLSGNAQTSGGAPIDMHWLVDDTETNDLIRAATF